MTFAKSSIWFWRSSSPAYNLQRLAVSLAASCAKSPMNVMLGLVWCAMIYS